MATKNLGQVAGVHIGNTPPENTVLIWFDNTPSQRCHKVYDAAKRSWVILDQNIISLITYTELVNIAKNVGLSIGKFYQIKDKSNALAIAITTTKVQYDDTMGNILIDDLGTNIQYHVTSQNLSIDDVRGVFNETNKTLVFRFDEQVPDFTADDYLLGKVQRNNVWRLAKYKLSSFLSKVTGNSITWNGGFFFNFDNALKGKLDKKGGVVSKDTYDKDMKLLGISIGNIGNENQEIINSCKNAIENATSESAVYDKKLPSNLETGGETFDIAKGDKLVVILSKVQKYINKFKYATGIKLSKSFVPSEEENVEVNNNDTVESAFAKVQKSLRDLKNGMISIYGDKIKISKTGIPSYNDKPDDITKDDSVAQALAKLLWFVQHVETDIMRIEMTSNVDIHDCGFGGILVKGEHNYVFTVEANNPYNPYRLDIGYTPNSILSFAPLTTAIKNPGNMHVTAAKLIHYQEGAATFQFQVMLADDTFNDLMSQGYKTVTCTIDINIYGYASSKSLDIAFDRIMWIDAGLSADTMSRGNDSHIIFKIALTFKK